MKVTKISNFEQLYKKLQKYIKNTEELEEIKKLIYLLMKSIKDKRE